MARLHPILIHVALFLSALATAFSSAEAEDLQFTEYEVKAGFIYNIPKFVEWPEGSWPASRSVMPLCVIGNDPFGKAIDGINGKTVKGKRLEIRRVSSIHELKDCQLAFISSSEKDRLPRIIEALKGSNTLTIGDTEGYISQGVIINFYLEGKKVRFEIDIERAKQMKLLVSSQLLKLARIAGERK